MRTCLEPAFQPKDPKLWLLYFPVTDYMSLGELLKPVWGLPALKVVSCDDIILLAPVKQA
jgi:hypothetical protein